MLYSERCEDMKKTLNVRTIATVERSGQARSIRDVIPAPLPATPNKLCGPCSRFGVSATTPFILSPTTLITVIQSPASIQSCLTTHIATRCLGRD